MCLSRVASRRDRPNSGVDLHAIDASSPRRRPGQSRLFRADARRRAATRPPPLRRRGSGSTASACPLRRGGDTDEYLGPSRTPSTRRVERRPPRVPRRSPHLELDALLAHEEVDVARRRSRRRPVAARLPRRRWGARRRHRRRRGDAAEAPRRLADPVLDAPRSPCGGRACVVANVLFGLSCTSRSSL